MEQRLRDRFVTDYMPYMERVVKAVCRQRGVSCQNDIDDVLGDTTLSLIRWFGRQGWPLEHKIVLSRIYYDARGAVQKLWGSANSWNAQMHMYAQCMRDRLRHNQEALDGNACWEHVEEMLPAGLIPRDRFILRGIYEDMGGKGIAKRLGVNKTRVTQLLNGIRAYPGVKDALIKAFGRRSEAHIKKSVKEYRRRAAN